MADDNRKILRLLPLVLLALAILYLPRVTPRQWRSLQPVLVKAGVVGGGAAVILGGVGVGVMASRRKAERRRVAAIERAVAEGETWLLLRPKEARPVEVEKVTLWKRLAYAQPTQEHFSFEAYGNADRQGLAIHASQTKSRAVLREFFQEWPDVQRRPANPTDDPAFTPEGWQVHWVEVGPASAEKPITISSRDPLLGVLSELADIPAPTRGLVQVIARSDTTTRRQLGLKSAAMRSGPVQDPGVKYQRTKEARLLEERGARLFMQAVIRVAAISPYPDRAEGAAMALANTLCNQFGPDNPVVILAQASPRKPLDPSTNPGQVLAARSIRGGAMRSWADDEIVALAHLPGGEALKFAPLLSTGSAKSLPAKPDLRIPKKARLARSEM